MGPEFPHSSSPQTTIEFASSGELVRLRVYSTFVSHLTCKMPVNVFEQQYRWICVITVQATLGGHGSYEESYTDRTRTALATANEKYYPGPSLAISALLIEDNTSPLECTERPICRWPPSGCGGYKGWRGSSDIEIRRHTQLVQGISEKFSSAATR